MIASRASLIALVLAAAAHALLPASLLQIGLAVVAFVAPCARPAIRHPRRGHADLLALPYDRAANNDLLRFASIPVRPHDVVVGLAFVGALPECAVRRSRSSTLLLGAFLALGVVALVIGFAGRQRTARHPA